MSEEPLVSCIVLNSILWSLRSLGGVGSCNLIIHTVRTAPLSGCCFCSVFVLQYSALLTGPHMLASGAPVAH